MKPNFIKLLFVVIFILCSNVEIFPQEAFGFGCLGLSGFYGGYSQQEYKADGINAFVGKNYSGTLTNNIKFEKGTGFRIGANIFRTKISDDAFLTLKGFFQFLKEEHEISENISSGALKNKYQLSMNHWGVSVDFGFPLFSILDWKVLEGGVSFYNSDFNYQTILDDTQLTELKVSPDKTQIGYYIGSGLILHIVRDYISVEGTAAYSFLKIDNMGDEIGINSSGESSQNKALGKGGFVGTIQLNVGFPF
jgi:hypothetical protein